MPNGWMHLKTKKQLARFNRKKCNVVSLNHRWVIFYYILYIIFCIAWSHWSLLVWTHHEAVVRQCGPFFSRFCCKCTFPPKRAPGLKPHSAALSIPSKIDWLIASPPYLIQPIVSSVYRDFLLLHQKPPVCLSVCLSVGRLWRQETRGGEINPGLVCWRGRDGLKTSFIRGDQWIYVSVGPPSWRPPNPSPRLRSLLQFICRS